MSLVAQYTHAVVYEVLDNLREIWIQDAVARDTDSERQSPPNARVAIFLVPWLRCAIHCRKHPSTTQERYALS
jgi:hypothetical protein